MPPQNKGKSNKDEGIIDASPGNSPHNITKTEAWKSSSRGISRFWTNYKRLLNDSFVKMSRDEQEALITKFSVYITVGVSWLIMLTFYSVMPVIVRLLAVPIGSVAAWWLGRSVVAQAVINRLGSKLNR